MRYDYVDWSKMEPVIHPPVCAVVGCTRVGEYVVITERGNQDVCSVHYVAPPF